MEKVMELTGFNPTAARRILRWFSRQAEAVQAEVLQLKQIKHESLSQRHVEMNPGALELAALLLAAWESGVAEEKAFASSVSISERAAKNMQRRRRLKAEEYLPHRVRVRVWLGKHWGKVMDMRGAGLSWRGVSALLADEYHINISHSALYNHWRNWNERIESYNNL